MFGIQKYRFEYSASPEDAARALERLLTQPKWESLVVKVAPAKVKIHKRFSIIFHNSFSPIFTGHFVPSQHGSTLIGVFRMHWWTIAFLLIFYGMIGYNFLEVLAQPEYREGYVEGWKEKQLEWQMEFFGLSLLILVVGWIFGIPSRNAIVRAIRESI